MEKKLSAQSVDYKSVRLLRRCIGSDGRILPRRVIQVPVRQQAKLARSIKRARILALLPFVQKLR